MFPIQSGIGNGIFSLYKYIHYRPNIPTYLINNWDRRGKNRN